ncbi:collagen alpha-1(I) chain-like [Cervus elaphus]|uniref:collagen alpha-1(I) chain-like n=1 Tax=Cervus elaphus TaxID=9860 RepID=UPI001CC29E8C|nr:collagen alpha-1(I) chain-like [Cervus elaphus]
MRRLQEAGYHPPQAHSTAGPWAPTNLNDPSVITEPLQSESREETPAQVHEVQTGWLCRGGDQTTSQEKQTAPEPGKGKNVNLQSPRRIPGRGAGGGLSAQCEASSASRGGSKPMNKAPASSVPYNQVSIINLRIRGPPAPSEGCAARVTSPPTSSGRALTRTTSEQAEGPGSASKQPGGPRGGDAAPRPSPAPRPAAGGSPINPCNPWHCPCGGPRPLFPHWPRLPGGRGPGPPALRNFPFARARLSSGTGACRAPSRPPSLPFPPAPTPGGRPAGRPRAAAPPPKMAGPSLRPAGLGAGPGCRPQWGKPGRRAPGGAAAGHSPGRWRGARAVPSGEFLPPASRRRRRRCAPAAASAASAAPAASLSAPGAPGSAVSEPQPPQVSLPGSRVRAAPGGAGVCVEAGEAAAPLPGKYRSPRTPSPAARRGPRGPARPGAEGGGGGKAGLPVAAASGGGFFFPEDDFVNLTKWRALQSCAARSAGARAAAAAAAAPQPGEPEPPAPESPRGAGPVARATADSVSLLFPPFPHPSASVPYRPTTQPPSGHVKDKFGARYECQRRARDSLGGGERRGDGRAERREGEEEDRAGGRVGAEAAARPVREHPPLPRPPSRTPARACRARADCGPGSARVPACAPPPSPAEPGASASRACSPARAGRAAGRARPRTQPALGPARVPPSPEKMPTEAAAAAAGGGEEAASALQTSQEFRTLRPGSGMPLRPTPLLNPGGRSLQRPAPAFRNDGRSHHKHSRLFHGFQPPHPPSLSGRSLPSPSECPEN